VLRVVVRQAEACLPGTKTTACFQAFISDIFGPLKETGPGGAKYLLDVIDYHSNYIWLLALSSKKVVVSTLSSVLTGYRGTVPHDGLW
jgi:hypothetical protein